MLQHPFNATRERGQVITSPPVCYSVKAGYRAAVVCRKRSCVVVSLKPEEKEILELYDEGSRLKDVARKSVDGIDVYLAAGERLRKAAALSADVASSADTEP